MVWGSMGCKGSLEHSDLSKASLVDGFKFPSAIALTIVEGISLITFGFGQGKNYMFSNHILKPMTYIRYV